MVLAVSVTRRVTERHSALGVIEKLDVYGSERASERASVGISVEKVDARYEWRGPPIENGITKNLSNFVRACHGYRRVVHVYASYEFYSRRQLP